MDTPFLTNLGIDPMYQQHGPDALRMPTAFNSANAATWTNVCMSLVHTNDAAEMWDTAIRQYIDISIDAGKYPFAPHRQHVNDRIFHQLLACRRLVVRFLNLSKLLKHCTIRSVTRRCEIGDTGFTLTTDARVVLNDPTFAQYLLLKPMPAFKLKHNGRYVRHLNDEVTMFVYNAHANAELQWHIGYQIAIPLFPDVPGNHVPSAGDLERFITNVLWTPVMKSNRPHGYHRRLL